ncbi:MAG: UvrD-helicase domain-containing protein [Deltaproteobacteria bacterium]|nr:UvrD-helicase domain-containing protein [Deltaproteobacteria bacterium]
MSFPLNPAQRAAVAHDTGPALVLAGAGSGKTRVITQRMARLLEQGTPPGALYAVTFTNKAAAEMHERLVAQCGPRGKDVWISTFHALGGELLRREMPRGRRFVVYDAADTAGLLRELLRELKGDRRYDVAALQARISFAKNALGSPDALPEGGNEYDDLARWAFPRYEAALARLHALDFDDLILWPLRHLTENPDAREAWQRRIRYLLVDEFQDTNRAQLLLLKALAGDRGNVFCVGDDDQSIYGWRGADLGNVLDFTTTHFPGARVLALEQNYRSRTPILDVANAVMEGQVRAFPKRLFTDRPGGEKVTVVTAESSEGEAKFVVDAIQKLVGQGHRRREIGVLYRSNLLSRAVEEGLRLGNVPYRLIGGTSVYERREVKDLLAYLRLALHPEDEIALRRVINYPTRGVGDVTLQRLERWALAHGKMLFRAVEGAAGLSDLTPAAREGLGGFVRVVHAARDALEGGRALAAVAREVAAAVRLREDVTAAGPTAPVVARRLQNLEHLYATLERAGAKGPEESAKVLTKLSLHYADADEADGDKVTLSTLHGSKGLEFGVVFFLGCDEGILPHARTDAPRATDVTSTLDVSEERRLFYVGVTRARERLYLLRARVRGGQGKAPRATTPSRFLAALPGELLERVSYDSQAPLPPEELAARVRLFREALAKRSAG